MERRYEQTEGLTHSHYHHQHRRRSKRDGLPMLLSNVAGHGWRSSSDPLHLHHYPADNRPLFELVERPTNLRKRPLQNRDRLDLTFASECQDCFQLSHCAEVRTLDSERALNRRDHRQRNLSAVQTNENQTPASAQ